MIFITTTEKCKTQAFKKNFDESGKFTMIEAKAAFQEKNAKNAEVFFFGIGMILLQYYDEESVLDRKFTWYESRLCRKVNKYVGERTVVTFIEFNVSQEN